MFVWLGIVLTVFGILIYVLWPKSAVIILLFVMLLGMGVGIYWCETQLNRYFDKNGNPNSAYYFDGSNGTRIHCGSGIELANKSHTVSIMAKQDDSNHHGHFFGHGAPGSQMSP